MSAIKKAKIIDLVTDDLNANKGSEYGQSLIERSLREFGAGRSILIDKNNRIIAGNKTIESAGAIGLEDVVVVETTGEQIVAVKRTDIDLDSKQGRELAIADNATAKANIVWDNENLETIQEHWDIKAEDWGIDYEKMPIFGGDSNASCDMIEKLSIHKKGNFYVTTIWRKSDDGELLQEIKNGEKYLTVFADKFTVIIKGILGENLQYGDYCIITAPKRRHKDNNFSSLVSQMVSERIRVRFYDDIITCKNKARISPEFKLEKNFPEKNVIVLDDIITTGSTLTAIYDLLKNKNCFFLVGINNNN